MHVDAEKELRRWNACQHHASNTLRPKNAMVPVTSSWPFQKWAIDITRSFPEAPVRVKFLIVAIDYFTKWIEAKAVAVINANNQRIKAWLKELNITQAFSSVTHPQGNGEVERANRSIVGGFKRTSEGYRSGDYVIRNNEASKAQAQGKLAPTWKGLIK
ncbi:uncharacterized protein LOC143537596 [Bidens hawaiensis]|uniref:uncharacterized protein LOC143537596 n=1 Tax=Bidens hawaiensis TaxID=980011 RepID=UPI00404A01BF